MGKGTREEQRARAAVAFGLGYRMPDGGLGRLLALWGFGSVPFFRAFREPAGDDEVTALPRAGERNGTRPPFKVPRTEGPDGG